MRTRTTIIPIIGLAAAVAAFALAGDVNPPPGPVAGTMKPLDQIEPRTPITALPFTITSSGSYYLAGNLTTATDGLSVDASDVTIDLMGFTITGPGPDSGTAVDIDNFNHENVTVRNGTVRAFLDGVIADTEDQLGGVSVVGVRAIDMGSRGIDVRSRNGLIRDCFAEQSETYDHPDPTTGVGIVRGVIEGCRAHGFDTGIVGAFGAVITDSVATAGATGLACSEGVVSGCAARGNSDQNLFLVGDAVAFDTYAP